MIQNPIQIWMMSHASAMAMSVRQSTNLLQTELPIVTKLCSDIFYIKLSGALYFYSIFLFMRKYLQNIPINLNYTLCLVLTG